MRIIGGTHKGRSIKPPAGLPVRPTTDFAKEGLFNILNNLIDLEQATALDLFSGTGHISLELASRGCTHVTAVDDNNRCVNFLRKTAGDLSLEIHVSREDVFKFLKSTQRKYDLVFADPPYDSERIPDIHRIVMERSLLNPGGWLIIEHGPKTNMESLANFQRHRHYGHVNFSFFQQPEENL